LMATDDSAFAVSFSYYFSTVSRLAASKTSWDVGRLP
jgi:hypothetical protein